MVWGVWFLLGRPAVTYTETVPYGVVHETLLRSRIKASLIIAIFAQMSSVLVRYLHFMPKTKLVTYFFSRHNSYAFYGVCRECITLLHNWEEMCVLLFFSNSL
jgi:hypothetical protein